MCLKKILKSLVYRVGGLNSLGCRGVLVGTEANSWCNGFWVCVGMERPNVAVDGNGLGSEGSQRESILDWWFWLGVTSISYMGSPEMVQNITLVIISRTRIIFESTCVKVCLNWIVGTGESAGGLSCFAVWVGKETAAGGKFFGFMVILSEIQTSEEGVVVLEPPGVGGGTMSVRWFLAFCKRWVLMEASYLRDGLRFRAMGDWVWWSWSCMVRILRGMLIYRIRYLFGRGTAAL